MVKKQFCWYSTLQTLTLYCQSPTLHNAFVELLAKCVCVCVGCSVRVYYVHVFLKCRHVHVFLLLVHKLFCTALKPYGFEVLLHLYGNTM